MVYKIKIASLQDIEEILKLYSDRIEWFEKNGINQWNKYLQNHPKSEFIYAIENNEYYIIKNQNEIIGGFQLTNECKEWKEKSEQIYYICKVVTKVGYKNIGEIIFNKCKEIAKINGINYLRLICVYTNQKLNDIYENYNFRLVRYTKNENYTYALRELTVE